MKKLNKEYIILKAYDWQQKRLFNRKLKKIYKQVDLKLAKRETQTITKYKILWNDFGKANTKYLDIFSTISGIYHEYYVPEPIYYLVIEPRLNNYIYTSAYSDKNNYEMLGLDNSLFPEVYLRKIDNNFYTNKFKYSSFKEANNIINAIGANTAVLKPSSDTSGGKNVLLISKTSSGWIDNDGMKINVEYLEKHFQRNLILQESIKQHSFFQKFNQDSINTVRVFSYRSVKDNKINILQSVLRIGREGSFVDNQAAGGYSIGISAKGLLNGFAINKYGRKFKKTNNHILVENEEVPFYNDIVDLVMKIAPRFFYNRLLGFDICIDDQDKVRILEVNCKNIETNFLQMNNGPLFGYFTPEIVEYCNQASRSVNFDFYFK